MEFLKKNWIKTLVLILCIVLIISIILITNKNKSKNANVEKQLEEEKDNFRESDGKNLGGGSSGQGNETYGKYDASSSISEVTELQSIMDKTLNKFKQLEFSDEQNGNILSYNLFEPNNYDSNKSYPLVIFIADSTTIGQNTIASLKQGYGGIIWAEEKEQEKHECFVLVPEYQSNIIDNNLNATSELESTVNLINLLKENYNINKSYITGQEMGGLATEYLIKQYPNMFNAALVVSCEWNNYDINLLRNQKVFYIVSESDMNLLNSQNNLVKNLRINEINVYSEILDATLDENEFANKIGNNPINCIQLKKGTVLQQNVGRDSENIAIYDCIYKNQAIRDWLFNQ